MKHEIYKGKENSFVTTPIKTSKLVP